MASWKPWAVGVYSSSLLVMYVLWRRRRRSRRFGARMLEERRANDNKGETAATVLHEDGPFLLVTDIDHTLVAHDGLEAALAAFNHEWLTKQAPSGGLLCYSTGRSLQSYTRLADALGPRLLRPDVLVCGDGTGVYWFRDGQDSPEYDREYHQRMSTDFDAEALAAAFCTQEHVCMPLPADACHHEDVFRHSSVAASPQQAERILAKIRSLVAAPHNYHFYWASGGAYLSGGVWVAAVPASAGKGNALNYVRLKCGVRASRTMCAGDSGNDLPMFKLQQHSVEHSSDGSAGSGEAGQQDAETIRGVIVHNAQPELLQYHRNRPHQLRLLARGQHAFAILEGMRCFNFLG